MYFEYCPFMYISYIRFELYRGRETMDKLKTSILNGPKSISEKRNNYTFHKVHGRHADDTASAFWGPGNTANS